jgi:hypothetical protein
MYGVGRLDWFVSGMSVDRDVRLVLTESIYLDLA